MSVNKEFVQYSLTTAQSDYEKITFYELSVLLGGGNALTVLISCTVLLHV